MSNPPNPEAPNQPEPEAVQMRPAVIIGWNEKGELGFVSPMMNNIQCVAIFEQMKLIALSQINFEKKEEPKVLPFPAGALPPAPPANGNGRGRF